jgi:plastocyanin
MTPQRSSITLGCAALVILAIGIYALGRTPENSALPVVTTAEKPAITAPSAAVIAQLQASKGFQALVSYTDRGFESATTTITQGETVRFTNNSTHPVWVGEITVANTPENPNTQTCDVPFNSCKALNPDDFKEFTFPTKGTFPYMDELDTATRGAIVVK